MFKNMKMILSKINRLTITKSFQQVPRDLLPLPFKMRASLGNFASTNSDSHLMLFS